MAEAIRRAAKRTLHHTQREKKKAFGGRDRKDGENDMPNQTTGDITVLRVFGFLKLALYLKDKHV